MDIRAELEKLRCTIIDDDEARTHTHREVLLVLAQTFDDEGAVLLCEPSVVGSRTGPPDIAIVDPLSGLHAIEVKGVRLDQVRAVKAGGAIEIEYGRKLSRKDPSRQARQAMFDVKDAAFRHFDGELHVPFQSWVVFPRIGRNEWEAKFGEAVVLRPDVIFSEDLYSSALRERLQKRGVGRLRAFQLSKCPAQQLRSVMAAFGDSEVLRHAPRPGPPPPEGSKGEKLNEDLAEYRTLTEQQQRLASAQWNEGPHLVRGVAGSGKTVVLATQAARMIERIQKRKADLFELETQPLPVLALCFNRTLVPFIRQRIELAYRQRADEDLPERSLYATHFNTLLYHLNQRGFCGYYSVREYPDAGERAARYLEDLTSASGEHAARLSKGLFHGIYVDEGQDFHENEYSVLLKLCGRSSLGLPRMFVFYDDAQNLYGLKRPTWSELGLEIRGRSAVMEECLRNTRQILEPAFNILVGTHAEKPQSVHTRGFADIQTLKEKDLITDRGGHISVHFSRRDGEAPSFLLCGSRTAEDEQIARRCEQLIGNEGLLPQDILVLTFKRRRASEISSAIAARIGQDRVRCAFEEAEKDTLAIQSDKVTVSTVASAKGYDAPYVIVSSVDEFPEEVEGRASLYVACTRAREWLEITAVERNNLATEVERALMASNADRRPRSKRQEDQGDRDQKRSAESRKDARPREKANQFDEPGGDDLIFD